jgi:hypothetical protein
LNPSTSTSGDDLFGWSPPTVPDPPARYPNAPGFKGPPGGASELAAVAMKLSAKGLRRKTLDIIKARGPMTADAAAVALERTPFSIRPRVAELHKLGLIEATTERTKGDSGMTVNRWQATEAGHNA